MCLSFVLHPAPAELPRSHLDSPVADLPYIDYFRSLFQDLFSFEDELGSAFEVEIGTVSSTSPHFTELFVS